MSLGSLFSFVEYVANYTKADTFIFVVVWTHRKILNLNELSSVLNK